MKATIRLADRTVDLDHDVIAWTVDRDGVLNVCGYTEPGHRQVYGGTFAGWLSAERRWTDGEQTSVDVATGPDTTGYRSEATE